MRALFRKLFPRGERLFVTYLALLGVGLCGLRGVAAAWAIGVGALVLMLLTWRGWRW